MSWVIQCIGEVACALLACHCGESKQVARSNFRQEKNEESAQLSLALPLPTLDSAYPSYFTLLSGLQSPPD